MTNGTTALGPSIALVTGGAGAGIGAGISTVMATERWHVVIADRDGDAAEELASSIVASGLSAEPLQLDVAIEEDVDASVDALVSRLGSVDALVNSAGVGLIAGLADIRAAEWDRLFAVDLRGAWLMSRACLRHMLPNQRGVLIHIGSVQALGAASGYGAYAAAKAGLVGMSRGIAADYGPFGIRSLVVHPGMVDSPQNREIFANFGDPDVFIQEYLTSRQLLPRLIAPQDVGAVVAFLAGPGAAAMTAAEVVVDGGSSAMAFDRRSEP